MAKISRSKLQKGIAPVLIIVGVAVAAAAGFVAYKKVVRPRQQRTPAANVPALPADAGELDNDGCNLNVKHPEGWTVAFNNTGPGQFNNDKWEGRCMIGLKSEKIDAPFAFLLNETPPGESFEKKSNDLVNNKQRNIGDSSMTEELTILSNVYTVRYDETGDKGVLSTYIQVNGSTLEVIGLYNPNQPETKQEVLQILTSLSTN